MGEGGVALLASSRIEIGVLAGRPTHMGWVKMSGCEMRERRKRGALAHAHAVGAPHKRCGRGCVGGGATQAAYGGATGGCQDGRARYTGTGRAHRSSFRGGGEGSSPPRPNLPARTSGLEQARLIQLEPKGVSGE